MLIDKLKQLMPKKPEPAEGSMLRFDPHPIRHHADYFAHAIDYELPANREELIALLWVFGEALNGEMERREQHLMRLVDNVIATKPGPFIMEKP